MTNPPDRELAVFSDARRLPAQERSAFLDQACAGDDALRQRVEELLQAGEEAGAFLQNPAVNQPGQGDTIRAAPSPSEKPGDRIGRYKLLQQIGEGGCGVVYMAEQQEPVNRRVALKVIKLGMDTKQVIARFEAERQALALMDHPNIAKVLDAGATETGRPFFVMELVRGIKITDYCDENNLSTNERLNLFIQVCRAIQHAHQKGIIHRDIKPSNILVTMDDRVALPKVIDFGIAKATQGKLTDRTLFTAFEQFIGTPAYMSPEQAEMRALDIDTRSDIYSLGVLLYELLTGQTPFDARKLLEAGLEEIRRTIREREPARPSTCLSTMLGADLTEIAKHRKAEPPKLIHLVQGDLDWIVMKCLEKDRTRRYDTANGVAMDIQRHLNCEPVVARPPSRLYEFQKTVSRHKFGFAAGAAVIAVLAAGVIVSTWMFFKEQQARQQAEAEREAAKVEAAKATAISDFFQQSLRAANPDELKGLEYTVRNLLDDFSSGLGNQFKDQPEVEASVRETIGKAYYRLGFPDKSQPQLERALLLRRRIFGEREEVAATLVDCAWTSFEQDQNAKGESQAREALDIYRKCGTTGEPVIATLWVLDKLVASQGRDRDAEVDAIAQEALAIAGKSPGIEFPETANILHGLAEVRNRQGKYEEGASLASKAIAMHRRLQGADHPETAWALISLGVALRGQGKLNESEAASQEALRIFRKSYLWGHKSVVAAAAELRLVLEAKGDTAAEEALEREILAGQRATYGNDSAAVAETLSSLAGILQSHGKKDEAEKASREAVDITRKLIAQDPLGLSWPPAYLRGDPSSLAALVKQESQTLSALGKAPEAEKLYEDAINAGQLKLGETNLNAFELLIDYGGFLSQEGKLEASAEYYLKVLPMYRRTQQDDRLALTLRSLGNVLNQIGRYQEAEAYLRESLALLHKLHQDDTEATGWATDKLAYALWQQQRLPEAEQAYRNALSIYTKLGGAGDSEYPYIVGLLQDLLEAENKPAEIEALNREVLATERSALGADSPAVVSTLINLADSLKSENKFEEAAARLREATDLLLKLPGEELAKLPTETVSWMIHEGPQPQARNICDKVLTGTSTDAGWLNGISWNLVQTEPPTAWDAILAVELANRAVLVTNRKGAGILDTLAAAYAAGGRFTNAVAVEQEAIPLLQSEDEKKYYTSMVKLYQSNTPYRDHGLLAEHTLALLEQGKFAEAEPLARECLALREKLIPDDWRTFNARSMLGGSLLGQKKYAEAEPLLLSGYEGLKQRADKIPAAGNMRPREALQRLVQLYEETGRPELATQWKKLLAPSDSNKK